MHRTAGTGAFCSSWRYRFLNFTHIAPRTIGLLLLFGLSLLTHSLSFSPNHSLPIFRSRFSHPCRKNPLLFYIARPVFVSFYCSLLSRALSLYGLLHARARARACVCVCVCVCVYTLVYTHVYALSSVPFVRADCSHGQTLNPIRCERRGERSEEGRMNPVKRRERAER